MRKHNEPFQYVFICWGEGWGGGNSVNVSRGYFCSFSHNFNVVHVYTLARSCFPMRLSVDALLSLLSFVCDLLHLARALLHLILFGLSVCHC